MKSQFERQMDVLAECDLYATAPVTAECPYCGRTFHPRWNRPGKDRTFGHYQVFCSKVCHRFRNDERRDSQQ